MIGSTAESSLAEVIRIVEERDTGAAVVIISTELEEVEALADRVLVMFRGRVVGVVGPETPRDVLGLMMAGVPYEEALASSRSGSARAGEDRS